jgi:hypothetical protein
VRRNSSKRVLPGLFFRLVIRASSGSSPHLGMSLGAASADASIRSAHFVVFLPENVTAFLFESIERKEQWMWIEHAGPCELGIS